MTNEEIKQLADELFEDLKDLKIKLGRIGKFDAAAVVQTYGIILEVIQEIEGHSASVGGLSGGDKKKLAVTLINSIVDIPWMPEYLEGAIFGWSIDLVVNAFNKAGGKDWLSTLFNRGE